MPTALLAFRLANLMGLSVGLYDEGKTCFYNFGTTEAGLPHLPAQTTIYEIGAISKTFTSLGILIAVTAPALRAQGLVVVE